MWREMLLFAVIIPAGIITAGVVYIKHYRKSPQGQIENIKQRQKANNELLERYYELVNTPALSMSSADFEELKRVKKELDTYDRMMEKHV